ncbi:hypothetical protein SK066_17880 [Paenibacillus hunanensis]|uniref:hypothetical protein n=1 Tax=Paenibacillus hunanensis TaxID=539262 RepID=UPI002A6B5889|nr:hypothetical protein [Paenibacillus hunanensis]WPP40453.1 hypothetical protein SK066_17880 [Paenibacillus hunanensis]
MANVMAQFLGNFSNSLSVSISRQISLALNNITINMPVYNISNSFSQVNHTVQTVNNTLNQLNVTQNNYNTTLHMTQVAQQKVTDEVKDTTNAQDKLKSETEDTTKVAGEQAKKWETIKKHVKQAADMANQLMSSGFSLAKDSLAGAAEDDDMRRKFVVTTGSGKTGTDLFEKYKKGALASGMDPTEVLNGSLSFLKQSAGESQIDKLNEMAGRLQKISGKSYGDSVQALMSGMSGDTGALNSTFGISGTGMDQAGLAEKGKSGDIDGYIQSLDMLMDKQGYTQQAFETMMDSPIAKWTQLTNNYNNVLATMGTQALAALAPALDALNAAFASDQFQVIIQAMANGFFIVANVIAMLVDGLLYLATIIQQNWNIIAPILSAIAFVLLAAIIIQLGLVVAEWLIMTWPILLVVAVIAIVIYILQQMGVTGAEMMGALVGAVYVVGEAFRIAFMAIWVAVATVVNFFVNLWYDALFLVQQKVFDFRMGFLNMLLSLVKGVESFANGFTSLVANAMNSVIKGINSVLPYFNKLFGTNWGSINLLEGTDFHSTSDGIAKMMGELEKQAPKEMKQRFQMEVPDINPDLAGAGKAGYNAGSGFANKFTQGTNGMKDKLSNYTGSAVTNGDKIKSPTANVGAMTGGSAYAPSNNVNTNNGNVDTVNHVNSLGSVDDTVDISSEDLKMMRDLAEMQAIQHFVTLTPTVQMTTGDINSGADLDTIVGHIGRKLEEEFVSTAQGVYT